MNTRDTGNAAAAVCGNCDRDMHRRCAGAGCLCGCAVLFSIDWDAA